MHCDHSRRELAQAVRGEPAREILGEHRETFLRLLVAGEAAGERPQLLVGAVDIGDHVGPDFVVKQGLGARR